MIQIDKMVVDYLAPIRNNTLKKWMKQTGTSGKSIEHTLKTVCPHLFIEDLKPLAATAAKLGHALDDSLPNEDQCKLGVGVFNVLAANGLVRYDTLHTYVKFDDDEIEDSDSPKGGFEDAYQVRTIDTEFLEFMRRFQREKRESRITEKPEPWTKPFNKGVPIVKRLKPAEADPYTIEVIPKRYRALNALQETEWEVNSRMLSYLQLDSDVGHTLFPPEPTKPNIKALLAARPQKPDETDSDFKRVQSEIRKAAKREYTSDCSKIYDARQAKRIAEEVEGQTLWFQHNMDSRGRFYPIAPYLQPQGSDLAKSLLRFAKPVEFDEYWVYVDLANKAGKDKLSFDDRWKWAKDRENQIMEVGANPFSDDSQEFLERIEIANERKTKFQFIATCMEVFEHARSGEYKLPVGMDGTNQGSQFITAIARCENVAEHVNLTQCSDRVVGDLYQLCGDSLLDHEELDLQKAPMLQGIQKGNKILRKLCKRSCMTYYYSCGPKKMVKHLLEDKRDYNDKMEFAEAAHLGYRIYQTLEDVSPRGSAIMKAMQATVKGNKKVTMEWKTPDGFTVRQTARKFKKGRIKVVLEGVSDEVKLRFKFYVDKPQNSGNDSHKLGIAANGVHALDANMMSDSICGMLDKGITQYHMIHDQYSVPPKDVPTLGNEARTAFYEIVKNDPLEAGMPGYVAPKKGNFQIHEVLHSPYFMC